MGYGSTSYLDQLKTVSKLKINVIKSMKQKQSLLFTKQNLHTPWHEFPCCSCLTTISAKFCTRHDSYTVVTCVTLSWRVQNFVVISRVHFKPEHCKFWSSLVRTPVALCWLWSCSASKAAIGVGTMLVQCRHCRPNIGPTLDQTDLLSVLTF